MKFLLTSHGSTGDIYPVIRLGHALVEAGHDVRFATVGLFREEVESAGITFVYLPPAWNQCGFAEAMLELTKAKNPLDLLRIIYSESLPFLDEILNTLECEMKETDVFVTNYVFANLCSLARKVGVPCAVTTLAHNVVPSDRYPPEGLPRIPAPRSICRGWNRILWKITDRLLCWQINRVVGEVIARHDMKRPKSFLLEPSDLVLVAVSSSLFQPKSLWDERFKFTGYLRWQSPEDPDLEVTLDAFCQGVPVPVLTFGSVTFAEAKKVMARFVRHWPVGKKIILQTGWAKLSTEGPHANIKLVERVSHDQLFKYASLVIHHGGAGTTGSVLHAGIPHIVIPHISDQWFFASEVRRLGVGIEVKCKRWPEDLQSAVSQVEQSQTMKARAKRVAAQLADENGPQSAVRELERIGRKS